MRITSLEARRDFYEYKIDGLAVILPSWGPIELDSDCSLIYGSQQTRADSVTANIATRTKFSRARSDLTEENGQQSNSA